MLSLDIIRVCLRFENVVDLLFFVSKYLIHICELILSCSNQIILFSGFSVVESFTFRALCFSLNSSTFLSQVGDGTTSVVIVAAELLKLADELVENKVLGSL